MKPFLWPGGGEPNDDYFAEDEDGPEAQEEVYDLSSLFEDEPETVDGAVQARFPGVNRVPFAGPGVVQRAKQKTPAQYLAAAKGTANPLSKTGVLYDQKPGAYIGGTVRSAPKKWNTRGFQQRTYGGRNYYWRLDAQNRTDRMEGQIELTDAPRTATKKTRGKRKNDHNGHLIAHSLGGDPKFTAAYVAMARSVNLAGGAWGRMEAYVRRMLSGRSMRAYMVTKPMYPGPGSKASKVRPDRILVSVYFSVKPYKAKFVINCT